MACKSLCKQWKAMHTDMAGWRYFLRGSWLSIFFGIHPPGASKYVMSKHCVKLRPPAHLSLRSDVTSHPGLPCARRSHHPSFHTRHMVDPILRHFTYHNWPDVT